MEWVVAVFRRQGAQKGAQRRLRIIVIVPEDYKIGSIRPQHSLCEETIFLLRVVRRHGVVSQLNHLPGQHLHSLPKDLGETCLILHSPSEGSGITKHSHADRRRRVAHNMSGIAVPPWRDANGRILKLADLARDEFEAQNNVIAILNNSGDGVRLEVGSEPLDRKSTRLNSSHLGI